MKRVRKLLTYMRKASPVRSIPAQVLDLMHHKLRVNLGPADYYYFEFYRPDFTWEQKSRYASAMGSRYWIFENNPFKYQVLFSDKYVQKILLTGLDMPTPALHAVIGAGGAVASIESFEASVGCAPDEFVLKPVSARGGRGFRKITKMDGELLEQGKPVSIHDLWLGLQRDIKRGVLLEEAVRNPEVIRRMNPSSLNTFRIVTFQLPDVGWVPICSYLKVGREGDVVDNSGAGGLLVRLESDGMTGLAIDFKTRSDHSHHPDSGAALAGIAISEFPAAEDLAVNASKAFSQMGVLGWDIALTESGPMIIEVNAAPACEYPQVAYGGLVTDDMARMLKRRHLFSRYPLTHMYPNHLRERRGRI